MISGNILSKKIWTQSLLNVVVRGGGVDYPSKKQGSEGPSQNINKKFGS